MGLQNGMVILSRSSGPEGGPGPGLDRDREWFKIQVQPIPGRQVYSWTTTCLFHTKNHYG